MAENDTYVPRFPDGSNDLPLEYSIEIDFNNWSLVRSGSYFLYGEAPQAGYWLQLEGIIDNVVCRRRLYLSVTEIGANSTYLVIPAENKPSEFDTVFFWPVGYFYKGWNPMTDKSRNFTTDENIFIYASLPHEELGSMTMITGLVDKPFGIVWLYGSPRVFFDREEYVKQRDRRLYNPYT